MPEPTETCASCGNPFNDKSPPPWRFETGPFVGKVVHQGDCEVNLAMGEAESRFKKRPGWQQRAIRRAAGKPPPWED
jgi:hypothetical protein